jgi:predicted flap endonuclease-1-like 5' DNA nuclease
MRLLFWRKPKKKPISPLWLLMLIPAGAVGYVLRERPWRRTAKPVAITRDWQKGSDDTEKSGKESRGNKTGMDVVQSEALTRYQKGGKTPAEIEQREDELEIIEGIGPKIAGILRNHGVTTFRDLANTSIDRLNEILHDGGIRINPPDTWPEQARLAANEDWDGLEDLKKRLHGGRK